MGATNLLANDFGQIILVSLRSIGTCENDQSRRMDFSSEPIHIDSDEEDDAVERGNDDIDQLIEDVDWEGDGGHDSEDDDEKDVDLGEQVADLEGGESAVRGAREIYLGVSVPRPMLCNYNYYLNLHLDNFPDADQPVQPTGFEECRLENLGAEEFECMLREDYFSNLRREFEIPLDVHLFMLTSEDRAHRPPRGCIALNYDVLAAGFRLPLHPMFGELLAAMQLSITQLTPVAWQNLVTFVGLMHLEQYQNVLTVTDFLYMFTPTALRQVRGVNLNGWYYLKARTGLKIIEEVDNKITSWKQLFFFVGGDWQPRLGNQGGLSRMEVPKAYGKLFGGQSNPKVPQYAKIRCNPRVDSFLNCLTMVTLRLPKHRAWKYTVDKENLLRAGLICPAHHTVAEVANGDIDG